MINKKFHLIVAANTKAYSKEGGMWAGELAGSVEAHCLHINQRDSVIYHCNFRNQGLAHLRNRDILDKLIQNFNKSLKINNKKIRISQYGFFYVAGSGEIRWIFKAKGLKTYNEIEKKELKEYLPYFQQYGIEERKKNKDYEPDEREWLLIKDIRLLKHPISCKKFHIYPSGKQKRLLKYQDIRPNAYVISAFDVDKIFKYAEKLKDEKLMSNVLIEVLKAKDNLREKHIHKYFLYQLKRQGYYVINEGTVKKGRFDIFYKDKKGKKFVIEFKLDADENSPEQLRKYIKELNKKGSKKRIKGVIICHNPTQKLIRNAKKYGYEVKEYYCKIYVPNLLR